MFRAVYPSRHAAVSCLLLAVLVSACSGKDDAGGALTGGGGTPGGSGGGGGTVPTTPDASTAFTGGGSSGSTGGVTVPFPSGTVTVSPSSATVDITPEMPQPEAVFVLERDGQPIDAAAWRVRDSELGTIDSMGRFVPTGYRAGSTQVVAVVGDREISATVTVRITESMNGDSGGQPPDGLGGVGGEGTGGPVSAADRTAFEAPADAAWDGELLYPYDGTVFPLELAAPLLQWDPGSVAVEAIQIRLSAANYEFVGTFAPPAAVTGAFVRHPIPQAVWERATRSAAGGSLSLELSVLAAGVHHAPLKSKWTIANGALKGTVYYQSYGTDLARNYEGAIGGDGRFGGATLAIKPGDSRPTLVAGGDGDHSQCRVCHSVSSQGTRMVVQHGDEYRESSSYALQSGSNAEMAYPPASRGQLGWIGLSPDGELGLGNTRPLGMPEVAVSSLYDMNTGAPLASTGLTDAFSQIAFPAFSHDGNRVAFSFLAGAGTAETGAGNEEKLVLMDFDAPSRAFSNPRLVYESNLKPGWPAFTPGGESLVFQRLVRQGNSYFETRYGAKGELWWSNLRTGESFPLRAANGEGYVPVGPNGHDADHELNYEPTVAPVASGGYAWVVFLSRRMYGNVATIDPWRSDPREYDHTQEVTPKKLWVAAVNLNVANRDGEFVELPDDPSHPAFYLPGQELHAGNTRGFWVAEPCKEDGNSCESGVDCCSGRCQLDEALGELTCGLKTNECAQEFERCEVNADCCDDSQVCLSNVCTQSVLF